MNTPSTAGGLIQVAAADVALSDAERAIELENRRRDRRANVFVVTMVGIGALTVLAALAFGAAPAGVDTTSGTSAQPVAPR
jgi:hypothetical protein